MTDADELARRYLALWAEYFNTLLADPRAMEMVKRWISFTSQFSYPEPGTTAEEGTPSPAWPPFFGPFGPLPAPSLPADASATREDEFAALTLRVIELERRVAELEGRGKQTRSRQSPRRRGD
jgi:hypothetical protein